MKRFLIAITFCLFVFNVHANTFYLLRRMFGGTNGRWPKGKAIAIHRRMSI